MVGLVALEVLAVLAASGALAATAPQVAAAGLGEQVAEPLRSKFSGSLT